MILDNVSSPESVQVHDWLKEHPDWRVHCTPTSASWDTLVEGFFSKLARKRLKNGGFNSLHECIEAIQSIRHHHAKSQAGPFKWTENQRI